MPWQDLGIIVEHEQALFNGMDQLREVPAPKVRPADALLE